MDAVVHAVNEDYRGMADDFINLGFLAPGTDVNPIVRQRLGLPHVSTSLTTASSVWCTRL